MSTELVYITRLCEWFELSTTDIENLIDAIPAYDLRNVSDFCRVDPPAAGENEPKLKPHEKVESKEARNRRRIGSLEAKLIAEAIAQRDYCIINLLNARDKILGKELPGYDLDANYEIRERKIRNIKESCDLRSMVYRRFLGVLCLNKHDAIKYIKTRPYILKLGAPTDIAASLTEPLLPSPEPVRVDFDTTEKPDPKEAAIAQWGSLLTTGRLSAADKKAVQLLLEKLRGKTHREAFNAIFPNDKVASPVQAVSKRLSRIQRLAKEHGFPMPKWDNNR